MMLQKNVWQVVAAFLVCFQKGCYFYNLMKQPAPLAPPHLFFATLQEKKKKGFLLFGFIV